LLFAVILLLLTVVVVSLLYPQTLPKKEQNSVDCVVRTSGNLYFAIQMQEGYK